MARYACEANRCERVLVGNVVTRIYQGRFLALAGTLRLFMRSVSLGREREVRAKREMCVHQVLGCATEAILHRP